MGKCRCCCSPAPRKRYDAHMRAADVPLLRKLVSDDPSIGTVTLIGEGFVIAMKHGHRGSISFELTETD